MPVLKSPPSLQRSCLDVVCRLPQEEWDRPHIAVWLPKITNRTNQPHNLSANLYQALLDHLIQTEQLQSWHLDYVAHESLKWIRFQKCLKILDNDSALLLSSRCPNLQDVFINSCTHLPLLGVNCLVCNFSNLRVLDITNTKADDDTMAMLADRCPELQKLDMTGTNVTDIGLFELCGLRESGKGCKKINRIMIYGIQVTLFGLSYMIKALKQLKQLGTEHNTGLVLYGIYHDFLLYNLPLSPLKLDYVSFSSRCLNDSLPVPASYIQALKLCPNVTGVVLRSAMLANVDEEILQSLSLLDTLEVEEDEYRQLTFQREVVPFLSRVGAKMQSVTFTGFSDVDMLAVSVHCPKVQELSLEYVHGIAEHPTQQVKDCTFHDLTSLSVEIYDEVSQEALQYQLERVLKTAPNLTMLHLWGVDCFTDDFMANVMQYNKFEFLWSLRLIECHGVSRKTIEALMDTASNFSRVIVETCEKLKKSDLEDIKDLAASKNLSFNVMQGWGRPSETNNEEGQWAAM
ncbi:Hypp503 [Branchiostoma lanceolatum]|uniref:Hypp503 protein n=1 Tax=Branchiostoma lanceolatum TaxID=7740 RepID=A0A8J9YQY7_BRALA|nr:Hypp503 [Branchiostoma lanceolatum]